MIYFGNLRSRNGSVKHSGDDLTGDVNGDDGLDNEVITVDFSQLEPNVEHVAMVLNSYRGRTSGQFLLLLFVSMKEHLPV